jgi:dihydrolipoamide dehydrogenase
LGIKNQGKDKVDVVIVGAGTAGLSALQAVRKVTDDFLLINRGHWGTTCAAVGCMPSKALIESAQACHRRHAFKSLGLTGTEHLRADVPAILARVRRLRDEFVAGPERVRVELGPRAISASAQLLGPECVAVDGREIRARRIILATGSMPIVPADWRQFGNRVLTTDSLFELADLPRRIAVIGLGAIGVELAQALARVGIEVAGFEAGDTLAGLSDPQVIAVLRKSLARDMAVHTGVAAELGEANGAIMVNGGGEHYRADTVLAAMGRRPNIAGLGLETLGVPLDDKGLPEVDPHSMQIGDLPVFMVGDANGRLPILHEAADEGYIAAQNALADTPVRFRRRVGLGVVFCSPGVARVGERHADLDPAAIAVGDFDFARQGRARLAGVDEGVLRIYADRASGKLVGAEMCAPAAEHFAHLLALAMHQGMSVRAMLGMPFYHPVLEEGLRSALRRVAREVSDTPASDLAHCPPLDIDALD